MWKRHISALTLSTRLYKEHESVCFRKNAFVRILSIFFSRPFSAKPSKPIHFLKDIDQRNIFCKFQMGLLVFVRDIIILKKVYFRSEVWISDRKYFRPEDFRPEKMFPGTIPRKYPGKIPRKKSGENPRKNSGENCPEISGEFPGLFPGKIARKYPGKNPRKYPGENPRKYPGNFTPEIIIYSDLNYIFSSENYILSPTMII